MEFVKGFNFWFFLIAPKNINAKNNEIKIGAIMDSDPPENIRFSLSPNLKQLKNKDRIIKDVYVNTDYDADVSPNGSSLTHAFYKLETFDVEDMDEIRKQVTIHLKLRGTWVDSRVKANFDGHDNNRILLPPIETQSPTLLWTPFKHLFINHMISSKNQYDPICSRFFKLYSSKSWFFGRYPPNTLLVSAELNKRLVISCYKWIRYSGFPHDTNKCKFIMKSEYVNAIFDVKVNANRTRNRFLETPTLLGFKLSLKEIPAKLKITSGKEYHYTQFGVEIKLQRIFENYIYNYYLPCILIVLASSLSFIIPLSAIPGRVGLVVTLFLTLTNMFIYARVYIIINCIFYFIMAV